MNASCSTQSFLLYKTGCIGIFRLSCCCERPLSRDVPTPQKNTAAPSARAFDNALGVFRFYGMSAFAQPQILCVEVRIGTRQRAYCSVIQKRCRARNFDMREIVHIGFSYQEGLPEQIVRDFEDDVGGNGVTVRSESRPAGHYASIEWMVPTAIVVYVLRPYFEALLSEAGKDHYAVLKRALFRLFAKIYGKKPESRPSSRSLVFSIRSVVRDGRSITFLFPEGVSHETYQQIVEELWDLLTEHRAEGDTDRLSELIAGSSGWGRALYMEYLVGAENWALLDLRNEIAKRQKDLLTGSDDNGLSDGSQ